MRKNRIFFPLPAVLVISAAVILGGCSSDSGGGHATPQTVNKGVITSLGSITLNGIRYNVDHSSIRIDDQSASAGSLAVGMVVTVSGTENETEHTGVANHVIFADDLQGPISTFDRTAGSLIILGITIKTDANTRYENTTGLAALRMNDIVEVSGLSDGAGAIRATFIEKKDAGAEMELKGAVIAAPAGTTFIMKASAAAPSFTVRSAADLPAGLASGSRVEVKVTTLTNHTITASAVELEDEIEPAEGEHAELEGFITGFVGNSNFKVNGVTINAGAVTGLTGLADDVKVEVEGRLQSGVLVASKVSVRTHSKGVITGFGSVKVNGVEYETKVATITMDDHPANEHSLSPGMVVRVKGTSDDADNTGVADEIIFSDDLQGPISTFDRPGGILFVMGTTVKTDGATVFENTTGLADLRMDDVVEVSGVPDGTGAIIASFIEKKTSGEEREIKGTVTAINTGDSNFIIRHSASAPAYTVDYLTHSLTLPEGMIVGSLVEVKTTVAVTNHTIVASEIEIEDEIEPSDGELLEIKGLISAFASSMDFSVDGIPVDASGSLDRTGVAPGIEVEVKGVMESGVLKAESLHVEREDTIKLEGNVTSLHASAGTLTLLGKTVKVDSRTVFEDKSSADLVDFSLVNVEIGDHLIIAGHLGSGADTGTVTASKLERENSSNQAMMQGTVTAFAASTGPITILSTDLEIGLGTEFEDASGTPLTRVEFFGAVDPFLNAIVVSAQWDSFVSVTTPVNKLEIESSPD